MVSDQIEIRDLRTVAIVGVLAEERTREQPLSFDVDVRRNVAAAALNDDLRETSNYAEILDVMLRVATEGRFQLLETLAHRAAQSVLDYDADVSSVRVTVRKLRPPVPHDVASVGVTCTLSR